MISIADYLYIALVAAGIEDDVQAIEGVLGQLDLGRLTAALRQPWQSVDSIAPGIELSPMPLYPTVVEQSRVLLTMLIEHPPLPESRELNDLVALVVVERLVTLNGQRWIAADDEDVADLVEGLRARALSDEQVEAWLRERMS